MSYFRFQAKREQEGDRNGPAIITYMYQGVKLLR